MTRLKIIVKDVGHCGDIYCDGHKGYFMIDNKTSGEKRLSSLEKYAATIEIVNWLDEVEKSA